MTTEEHAANWRKKRGTIRSSITKLSHNLAALEASGEPDVSDHAALLVKNLERLDTELRSLHFKVLDLVNAEDEETLDKEQEYLDKHSDTVTAIQLRLQKLTTTKAGNPISSTTTYKALARKLLRLERKLRTVSTELDAMRDAPDVSLLELYNEQLIEDKKTLSSIYDAILDLDLNDDDELLNMHPEIERLHFDCLRQMKKLPLQEHLLMPSPTQRAQSFPSTFDGDILSWTRFWEQFSISVHGRKSLTDAEKLVYLQQAIKKGTAKSTIEGLTQTGENYEEAVSCLKSRYDRPRLIYRTHVQKIMDVPPLKDNNGRDLRRLHDMVQQHLRALKAMDNDLSGAFITSIIELKLDTDTLFEWQKHSQAERKTPHYDDLLKFIDLRAQASETSMYVPVKKPQRNDQPSGGRQYPRRNVASHPTSTDSRSHCVICSTEKHPLYACPKFKDMTHAEKLSTLKDNNLCNNCLNRGHSVRYCKSLYKCKKCQRPHHTLLHIENQQEPEPQISSNAAVKLKSSSLLMTCRVIVTAPNGSAIEARALLDNASSASFVTEHLAQSIRLPRSRQNVHVSGIGGISPKSPAHSIASLQVSPTRSPENKISLSAIVVPKVTCDLPLTPVNLDPSWNHLANLPLADPDYGKPGHIDLLLGVEVFVDILRHGRQSGPPGSPSALETLFGWVLSGGSVSQSPLSFHVASLHTTSLSGDDLLRRFWEIEEGPSSSLAISPEEKLVVQHYEDNHSRTSCGRFIVPLPKRSDTGIIGESRSQAVRRFLSLERSLHSRKQFQDFNAVMQDYLDR